ncbi:MAG: hypothetical protein FWG35_02595 [Spirochaetaceae bacterium]|nr:hypothetical protein [Spirochaetaceae bacterium]
MMTYTETIDLREKLEKDKLSPDEAKEIYFADINTRSWHTKDWQERRKWATKDKCEQCGSIEVLTLQHSSHPSKYKEYYFDAYKHFYSVFIEENSSNLNVLITKKEIEDYIDNAPRETFTMCPQCGWNYRLRMKKPQLVCTRCKYEFDEPARKPLPEYIDNLYNDSFMPIMDKPATAPGNRKIKYIMLYSEIRDKIIQQKIKLMVKDEHQRAIDKKAMIDYLDAQIKYLSFEGTKTLCKKCAFNQDMNGKDLCPACRKNYKSMKYETCVDCLPDGERKNQIKEYYEFVKMMNKIE